MFKSAIKTLKTLVVTSWTNESLSKYLFGTCKLGKIYEPTSCLVVREKIKNFYKYLCDEISTRNHENSTASTV